MHNHPPAVTRQEVTTTTLQRDNNLLLRVEAQTASVTASLLCGTSSALINIVRPEAHPNFDQPPPVDANFAKPFHFMSSSPSAGVVNPWSVISNFSVGYREMPTARFASVGMVVDTGRNCDCVVAAIPGIWGIPAPNACPCWRLAVSRRDPNFVRRPTFSTVERYISPRDERI
jgi:hypothetical protein